jgi:signal peptidase I
MKKIKQIIISNLTKIKPLIIKIVCMLIFFYITLFMVFGITKIKDISMRPSIEPGTMLIYYRLDNNYNVGDVVTFVKDNKRYNLRIIGKENDIISINLDGELINNNSNELPKTYMKNIIPNNSSITYPYRVGKNKLFLVGDNRLYTNDSREFGAIDISLIEGKIIGLLQTKAI